MNEWQEIETAPKDGSLIDLIFDGDLVEKCKWFRGCWAQFNNEKDEVKMFNPKSVTLWRPHVS